MSSPSGPPSYSATKPKNVQEILEPCSDGYFSCPQEQQSSNCFRQFGQCSLDRLADKTITDGILPPELTEPLQEARNREEDEEMLPKTLLECILDYQNCIVPNIPNCMADFQSCSLRALEDSRRRRLLNAGGRENVEGPKLEEADEDGKDVMSEVLSRNFTQCVAFYTDCVDFYSSAKVGSGAEEECAEGFDQCSLALLFDSNLNGTDPGASELEQEALEILDGNGGERRLATELYECIRDHMMCLMGADRTLCMGDYQDCSLAAMDRARRKKNRENNLVETDPPGGRTRRPPANGNRPPSVFVERPLATIRPPHGEAPGEMVPNLPDKGFGQSPSDRGVVAVDASENEIPLEGRDGPGVEIYPPGQSYLPPDGGHVTTPLPGIIAHGGRESEEEGGRADPRGAAGVPAGVRPHPGDFLVVESREGGDAGGGGEGDEKGQAVME